MMQELTYETILKMYPADEFKQAIKTGTLMIRPFTEEDERNFPPTRDLEGRLINVQVGRCLCVGVEGELFSCSVWSVENEREPVNPELPPDTQGFREYRIRNPHPIRYIILDYAFRLHRAPDDVWSSQRDGAVITWNGKTGAECSMRVIKTSIFLTTYKLLE